jgi:hypothetical protein
MKTLIALLILLTVPVPAQDQTRRLWNSELFKPAAKQPAGRQTQPRRRYRNLTPELKVDRVNGDTVLGVTLWRLRPATARDDERVRLFKHAKDDTKVLEWTPERISIDTPLSIGQRIRLSIESARTGYLYVINREMYADGTMGDPFLIFPTSRLRGGNHRVTLGQITEIPALEDSPNYFRLDPDRPDLVGEQLSVLVTPEPLVELKIGEEPLQLSRETVAAWEQKWGTGIGRMELEGAAGAPWTREEREASQSAGHKLKRDSPTPQTIFYRPESTAADGLMLGLKLRYAKRTATK